MSIHEEARRDWYAYRGQRLTAEQVDMMQDRLLNDQAYAEAWLVAGRFEADLADLVHARAQRKTAGHVSHRRPIISANSRARDHERSGGPGWQDISGRSGRSGRSGSTKGSGRSKGSTTSPRRYMPQVLMAALLLLGAWFFGQRCLQEAT